VAHHHTNQDGRDDVHVHFHLAHDHALLTDREEWQEAFGLFARISEVIAGEALAGIVRQAVDEPDDVQALYNLGYELIEQGLPGIAATAGGLPALEPKKVWMELAPVRKG
jgi:hypothetical protein